MLKKLTIENGIIKDKFIDGIPVHVMIVKPVGDNNVRTLRKRTGYQGITNHDTANPSPTAHAKNHAAYLKNLEKEDVTYLSVHLFVDCDCIVQTLPLDEVSYNAGDGTNGPGNCQTISIEMCENKDRAVVEKNAKKLNAALLATFGGGESKIHKHQDWSGKYCPHIILSRNGWNQFKMDIMNQLAKVGKKDEESTAPAGIMYRVQCGAYKNKSNALELEKKLKKDGFDTYVVKVDDLYKVQCGAYKNKSNAVDLAKKLDKKGYNTFITTYGGNPVKDNPKPKPKPSSKPKPKPKPVEFHVGDWVGVKQGAKDFNGNPAGGVVRGKIYYTLDELKGDRAVLDIPGICTPFRTKDLFK